VVNSRDLQSWNTQWVVAAGLPDNHCSAVTT